MIRTNSDKTSIVKIVLLAAMSTVVGACGSSGGTETPPAPPAPVAPPPPPPEPTFEERLEDLAEYDPNGCRARTPGFEALGGWLKNDGRELGTSRIWVKDTTALDEEGGHGANVWRTLNDCAVRSTDEGRYFYASSRALRDAIRDEGNDAIQSESLSPPYEDVVLPEPVRLSTELPDHDGSRDGVRVLLINALGNYEGKRTGYLQTSHFQGALDSADTALWLLVGGYVGEGDDRAPASRSSVCGDPDAERGNAAALCLFAPWQGSNDRVGTSHSTPQVSAALDSVWAVWPDMDILDLRNLAFDCAENMPAPDGEDAVTRSYSYANGRSFTSDINSRWGHGILSLTCLFTPNGGLQNPVTGNPISGGIYGPIAGPVTGAAITGVDYTGRDFGYGFARPVARQNFALAATANLRPVQAIPRWGNRVHGKAAYHGSLWQRGALRVDLTAVGNAFGAVAGWEFGSVTIRGGIAVQPEGVGSLTGSRAFRAPITTSAAITAAYAAQLRRGFSAHLQADHWRSVATRGRSLWEDAQLNESRLSAALVRRMGQHELALQGVWRSGLSGSLDVSGRKWAISPRREKALWLTYKHAL